MHHCTMLSPFCGLLQCGVPVCDMFTVTAASEYPFIFCFGLHNQFAYFVELTTLGFAEKVTPYVVDSKGFRVWVFVP